MKLKIHYSVTAPKILVLVFKHEQDGVNYLVFELEYGTGYVVNRT